MSSKSKKLETLETARVRNKSSRPSQGIQRKYWVFRLSVISDLFCRDLEIKTVEDVKSMLKKLGAEYIFQVEAGEESDYLHFQGSIAFPKKGKRAEEIRKVMPHAWLEPSESIAADKYASKSETRIDGPFMYPYRYMGEDLPQEHQLYEWQRNLISMIDGPVNPRKVTWVYDIVGGKGKSTFAKYLAYHKSAMVCGGELKDIAYAVTQMKKTEKPIFIFDLCRSQGNRLSYASLESLANGLFFSPKYESAQYIGPRPHIIVFANFYPDTSKLSSDRWDIRKLD